MPTYGKYETVRELSRGPLATVFVAHPSGKPGRDEFVVKAYVIGAQVADKDEAKAQAKRFLARVEAMGAIGRGKARHWAPVLDSGMVPTGAFYVTKRYPRSIDQLISGRVRLDAGALYNIVWSIFQGLRECQQHAGRPHGALKASNVLLDRVGQVGGAKVVLTDPAPAGEIDPVSGELEDLRALGRLIYQLVFFSPFRELGGWPIAESAEWNRLGKNGSAWRSLSNRLLDPGAQAGSLTLESLEGELRALRVKAKGSGKKFVAVATVVLLLGGAGAIVATGAGKPVVIWVKGLLAGSGGNTPGGGEAVALDRSEVRADVWKPWCDEQEWYEKVVDALDPELAQVEADAYVAEHFLSVGDDLDAVDPRVFAGKPGMRLADLARDVNMPEVVLTQTGLDRAKAGLATLRSARLSLGRADSDGGWPARAALDGLSSRAEALGWSRTHKLLGDLEQELDKFGGQTAPSDRRARKHASAVVELVGVGPTLERLNGLLGEIDDALPVLGGSGDPMLARFGELAEGLDGRIEGRTWSRLDELELRLTELAQLARDLAQAVASDRFKGVLPEALVELRRERVAADDTPSADRLASYLVLIQSYTPEPTEPIVLTDARNGWDLYGRIRAVEQRLAGLSSGNDGRLGDRLAAIGAEVGAIDNERARIDDLPLASKADEQAIASLVAGLDSRMDSVEKQLDEIREEIDLNAQRDISAYIEAVRQDSSISRYPSAAINGAWVARRDTLLTQHATDDDGGAALRSAIGSLRRLLSDIDARFEAEPDVRQTPTGYDAQALAQLVEHRREEQITALLGRVGFDGGGAADAAALDEPISEVDAYNDWVASIGTTLASLARLEQRIDACEPLDAATGGTVLTDLDALPAGALADAAQLAPAFMARVDELRALAGASDPAVLMAAARDAGSDVPTRIAAWRRLMTLDGWPRTADELNELGSVMTRVRASLATLDDAQLRTTLGEEIARDGAGVWGRLVESARTDDQLRGALAAGSAFDTSLIELSPRSRYNRLVLRLVDTLDTSDEQAARDVIESFVQQARGIEGLTLTPAASSWLDKLERVASGAGSSGGGTDDLRGLGPGAHGWSIDPASTMQRVVYRSPGGQQLAFVRLDQAGPDPVYLSTTEVSIGLFAREVERTGGYDRISTLGGKSIGDLSKHEAGSVWTGPVGWIWQGGVVPSQYWLYRQTPGAVPGAPVIAPGLSVQPASWQSPMTLITAPMAQAFAAQIGCRLPTPDEWEAAMDVEQASGGLRRWNLRDQTFGEQKRYMEGDFERAAGEPAIWPDSGSYTTGRKTQGEKVAAVEADATVLTDQNDGALWYMPVDGGGSATGVVFKHLVGNVAELVESDGQYQVMGASAISAPEVLPATTRGVRSRTTIADSGFRLAFSAPGTSAQESLARTMDRLLGERVLVLGE